MTEQLPSSASLGTPPFNEGRYRAVVDHLPDTATWVLDTDHRIIIASGAGLYGMSGSTDRSIQAVEVIGRIFEDVTALPDAARMQEYLVAAFDGQPSSAEMCLGGSGKKYALNFVPMTTPGPGRGDEVLILARDIGRETGGEPVSSDAASSQWRTTFDGVPVGVAEIDLHGYILRSNQALGEILDCPTEWLRGRHLHDYLPPDEQRSARARIAAIQGGDDPMGCSEQTLITPSGVRRSVTIRGTRLSDADGGPDRLLVHVVDVTDERLQQARLEAAHARYSALVEHSSDAVLLTSAEGRVIYASPAWATLTGLDAGVAKATSFRAVTHPTDRLRVNSIGRSLVAEGTVATFECRIHHTTAGWRHVEVTTSNRLHDPAVMGIVCNVRDVTDRVEASARVAHQAMHDTLTDLPNRALLLDRLDLALARAGRTGSSCALLFVDLDSFKQVNDRLGHAIGDQLLITVAERLTKVVRPGDSVARLGGDEFVVLAETIDDPATALDMAERIRKSLGKPLTLAGRNVSVGCSIGVAVSQCHDAKALLNEADFALYRAKAAGGDRWGLYDDAMRTEATRRLDIEELVRTAMVEKRLVVHHQPVVDLGHRGVVGTEALVRIRHPGGQLVEPDDFIAIAEDCGLIVPLGAFVLHQACVQHTWGSEGGGGPGRVAVNVSGRQLASGGFAIEVAAALAATGLSPEVLCLELTESALVDMGSGAQKEMHALKALGVLLALDDFGTGRSSLAFLRQFPFDIVKIDRSIVAGIRTGGPDLETARAVIRLGRALGLQVVAEGVETEEQHALLAQLGCHYAQGFLYGPPEAVNPPADLLV